MTKLYKQKRKGYEKTVKLSPIFTRNNHHQRESGAVPNYEACIRNSGTNYIPFGTAAFSPNCPRAARWIVAPGLILISDIGVEWFLMVSVFQLRPWKGSEGNKVVIGNIQIKDTFLRNGLRASERAFEGVISIILSSFMEMEIWLLNAFILMIGFKCHLGGFVRPFNIKIAFFVS